jgi:hypothetical protein
MIDNLTNGMKRLSEQISALRHNRAVGRAHLSSSISEMISGFQSDRQQMGEKTKAERDEARANLERNISEMISGFQSDRQQMGEKTRFEVAECVSHVKDAVINLRQSVAGLRADFASDIKGAQAVWSGSDRQMHEAGSNTGNENH